MNVPLHLNKTYWRHFVAQHGICPLCGQGLGISQKKMKRTTWDHVMPRHIARGVPFNRVAAHEECNAEKGDRLPHPCELLFLSAVNLVVYGEEAAL